MESSLHSSFTLSLILSVKLPLLPSFPAFTFFNFPLSFLFSFLPHLYLFFFVSSSPLMLSSSFLRNLPPFFHFVLLSSLLPYILLNLHPIHYLLDYTTTLNHSSSPLFFLIILFLIIIIYYTQLCVAVTRWAYRRYARSKSECHHQDSDYSRKCQGWLCSKRISIKGLESRTYSPGSRIQSLESRIRVQNIGSRVYELGPRIWSRGSDIQSHSRVYVVSEVNKFNVLVVG